MARRFLLHGGKGDALRGRGKGEKGDGELLLVIKKKEEFGAYFSD